MALYTSLLGKPDFKPVKNCTMLHVFLFVLLLLLLLLLYCCYSLLNNFDINYRNKIFMSVIALYSVGFHL